MVNHQYVLYNAVDTQQWKQSCGQESGLGTSTIMLVLYNWMHDDRPAWPETCRSFVKLNYNKSTCSWFLTVITACPTLMHYSNTVQFSALKNNNWKLDRFKYKSLIYGLSFVLSLMVSFSCGIYVTLFLLFIYILCYHTHPKLPQHILKLQCTSILPCLYYSKLWCHVTRNIYSVGHVLEMHKRGGRGGYQLPIPNFYPDLKHTCYLHVISVKLHIATYNTKNLWIHRKVHSLN